MKLNSAVAVVCCLEILLSPVLHSRSAYATSGPDSFSVPEELGTKTANTEYVSGNRPGVVLMPINLIGSANRPGVHHIPTDTDLLRLLALAGGPATDADLEEVTVKRRQKDGDQTISVNLKNVLRNPAAVSVIPLQPNDIIYIPERAQGVSDNTLRTLSMVSLAVGVVLSTLLIRDQFRDRTLP